MSSGRPSSPDGPPYASPFSLVGGRPTKTPDIALCAVFLAIFLSLAAFNMTIPQLNLRRGHKFLLSGVTFGFCMARSTALVMRIVWACRPSNVRVAIAANIFANAGVILLFVVNLISAQRILRAYHPRLGWSTPVRLAFRFIWFSILACLIMVIVSTVYTSYTLNQVVQGQLREVRLVAVTYLAVLAALPLPIVGASVLFPRKQPINKFGTGRMRTKVGLVLFSTTLLLIGALYRCVVSYPQHSVASPPAYHHKAAFFIMNFVIEIVVVSTYAFLRFDQRFWIPNGSSNAGDYASPIGISKPDMENSTHGAAEGASSSDRFEKA